MQDQAYNDAYHVKLQGVLYDILKRSGYDFVHREMPYKFVVFSNIFPPNDMKEGDEKTWIVASPNEHLIKSFSETVSSMSSIRVGDQKYRVNYTTEFEITPDEEGRMITGTPIVVRIPETRSEKYGIDSKYDDIYWRLEHPKEAFIEEIETNLKTKYEEYYDREAPERPYFTNYEPRDEVAVPLKYEDDEVQVIATTWSLSYECRTRPMYRIIKLAYSAGVGEMNTTGFGFMNEE